MSDSGVVAPGIVNLGKIGFASTVKMAPLLFALYHAMKFIRFFRLGACRPKWGQGMEPVQDYVNRLNPNDEDRHLKSNDPKRSLNHNRRWN